jgi:hypothetical protein
VGTIVEEEQQTGKHGEELRDLMTFKNVVHTSRKAHNITVQNVDSHCIIMFCRNVFTLYSEKEWKPAHRVFE